MSIKREPSKRCLLFKNETIHKIVRFLLREGVQKIIFVITLNAYYSLARAGERIVITI